MKLNKIETSEALSLTKPSYSVPPELEAAWLGYKHSIQGGKKNEEEQESFWKNVVEDVEKGLGLVKPWKRDGAEEVEAELLGKGRGHGVPLSGQSGLSLTCFVFSLFTECLCSSSLFILRLLHSTSIQRSPPTSSTSPFILFSAFFFFSPAPPKRQRRRYMQTTQTFNTTLPSPSERPLKRSRWSWTLVVQTCGFLERHALRLLVS